MKLITILESQHRQPRALTPEENCYIDQLGRELHAAGTDAARWRILEREGLQQTDNFGFDPEVLVRLAALQRAALN